MAERNPYLILGVDYGAPGDLARRRFAAAARRIRRATDSTVTVEDLNWALHEVESNKLDPFDAVDIYRVPADPAVFEYDGAGLFRPVPVLLERRTRSNAEAADAQRAAAVRDVADLVEAVAQRLVHFDFGYTKPEEQGQ